MSVFHCNVCGEIFRAEHILAQRMIWDLNGYRGVIKGSPAFEYG